MENGPKKPQWNWIKCFVWFPVRSIESGKWLWLKHVETCQDWKILNNVEDSCLIWIYREG